MCENVRSRERRSQFCALCNAKSYSAISLLTWESTAEPFLDHWFARFTGHRLPKWLKHHSLVARIYRHLCDSSVDLVRRV